MLENVSLLAASGIAFGAGLASFLSPCVLPLAPVYLASLAGPEIFDTGVKHRRLPIFLHSLSFVIGFSVLFSLWGAGAGFLGSILVQYSTVIRYVVGALMIVFGLAMLAARKISWLNYEKRLNISTGSTTGYLRSLLTGGIFSLAWTPCLGWQISAMLSLAGGSGTALQGTYLLIIYSLGLGLPFLILGAAFDFTIPLLRNINRYSKWIYIISGVLLIVVGILILTDKLVLISAL
ncbi:cytochrome c biogenesis CcdA family protein [Chloroflexota bacterium]